MNKNAFLCLLPLLFLLHACRDLDDPILEPSSRETGFILPGESGPGIVSSTTPYTLVAGSASPAQHILTLDSTSLKTMTFGTWYYSDNSPSYSYEGGGASVSADVTVEFAATTVQDTVWDCEEWNQDSTRHYIYHYNHAAGISCTGTAVMASTYSYQLPLAYVPGDTIDQQLPWLSGGISLASSHQDNRYTPSGNFEEYESTSRGYDGWAGLGPRYIAFRWHGTDQVWKYGYALVEVLSYYRVRLLEYGFEE